MKKTIGLWDFQDAFQTMDRGENFSQEGLEILFDYLEQYEGDTGEEIELDVIAICCEYTEDTADDIIRNYDIDITDNDDIKDTVREYLAYNTTLIGETDDTFIYVSF
jgi:hypothetical protein